MNSETRFRLIINLVTQTGTEIVGALMGLVLTSALAKTLGPEIYGQYILALSLAGLFGVGVEFGSNRILVRQIARSPENGSTVVANGLILRGLAAVIMSILLCSVLLILGYTPQAVALILVIWLMSCINLITTTIRMWFHGLQRMEYDAIIRGTQAVLTTVIGLAVLSLNPSMEAVAFSMVAVSFVTFITTYLVAVCKIEKMRVSDSTRAGALRLARMGLPILVAGLFASISFRADSVLLSIFSTEVEVGQYGAAYNTVLSLALFSLMLNNVFFPLLSVAYTHGTQTFQTTVRATVRYVGLLGLPMSFGLFTLSEPIINLIYGAEFTPAILLMRIVSPALALMFLSTQLSTVCIALNKQHKILPVLFISAVVNVSLNIVLIPSTGAVGASIVTTLTEFVALVSYLVILRKVVPLRGIITDLLKTSFAVALMVAVLMMNLSVSLIALIPLGAITYFVTAWVLGAIPLEDKARVLDMARSWKALYRTRTL